MKNATPFPFVLYADLDGSCPVVIIFLRTLCVLSTQETMRGVVDVKGVHFTWATGGVMVGGATPERWRVGGAWEVLDHYVPRTPTPFADYF